MNTQVTQYSKHLQSRLMSLNWDRIGDNLLQRFSTIILATIIFAVILWLGKWLINSFFKRTSKIEFMGGFHRAATFRALTLNIFRYTTYFCYLYAILSLIGVPIGTLIAGAGILSIAVGLGAQSFVSDVVNGFFILLEQQFDVGDEVELNNIHGKVVGIGMRTTRVLSSDGTVNFIPNRTITVVKNFSRHDLSTNIDLQIAANAPIEQINNVIAQVNSEFMEEHDQSIDGKITIVGPISVNGQLVFRVVVTTKQNAATSIHAALLSRYLKALAANNIVLENKTSTN